MEKQYLSYEALRYPEEHTPECFNERPDGLYYEASVGDFYYIGQITRCGRDATAGTPGEPVAARNDKNTGWYLVPAED